MVDFGSFTIAENRLETVQLAFHVDSRISASATHSPKLFSARFLVAKLALVALKRTSDRLGSRAFAYC